MNHDLRHIFRLCLLVLLWLSMTLKSQAHWADLTVAEVVVEQKEVSITLTFPTGFLESLRKNLKGPLSLFEINSNQALLQTFFQQKIQVKDGDDLASLASVRLSNIAPSPYSSPNKSPHTTLLLHYVFSHPIKNLHLNYDLFLPDVPTASCLATILESGKVRSFVFNPESREFSLEQPPLLSQAWTFMLLGIKHILTGYDHILFLVSLLILSIQFGYLLRVITAFTIAHSITLSLSVLNIVILPSRWVEAGIALTVLYVAAENLWRNSLKGRWLVTFFLGLIHGLGFASILKELIPHSNIPVSLAGFNFGVEIGQMIVVGAIVVVLKALQSVAWEPLFRRLVSVSVMVIAAFWFIQRAFFISP